MTDVEINDLDEIEKIFREEASERAFYNHEFVYCLPKSVAIILNIANKPENGLSYITIYKKNKQINRDWVHASFEKSLIAVEVFEKCVEFMKKHNSQIKHDFKNFPYADKFFIV